MSKPSQLTASWVPNPHPDWVQAINDEADSCDLQALIPLDAKSLLETATRNAGLSDFGDEEWKEPFAVLTESLAGEADLTLLGRLQTRNELLLFLETRLRLNALWNERPQILEQPVLPPIFILGLPRSGTSILYELLALDPRLRVPASWEALFPWTAAASIDPKAAMHRAERMLSQWARVVPEYATMHEMGAQIPCECGLIMAPSFRGDHLPSLLQVPSYNQFLAEGQMGPAYEFHRRMLQTLQWQSEAESWLLKAPNHLSFLPLLFEYYPDARIIQTHRDPIKCMASTLNLLGYLFWMRSDQAFESTAFEDIILGQGTATRLENAMHQRDGGELPAEHFFDSRYQELLDSPLSALQNIYDFLQLSFPPEQQQRVANYLQSKPKGKFGSHDYERPDPRQIERDRPLFERYQRRYQVPNEY